MVELIYIIFNKGSEYFFHHCRSVSFRFSCPGPGVFECMLTKLVFTMHREGELLYRTVQWNENHLQSAGKRPAGPLFDIKCSEEAVSKLHFPHCEQKPGKYSECCGGKRNPSHFLSWILLNLWFVGNVCLRHPYSSLNILFFVFSWTDLCLSFFISTIRLSTNSPYRLKYAYSF